MTETTKNEELKTTEDAGTVKEEKKSIAEKKPAAEKKSAASKKITKTEEIKVETAVEVPEVETAEVEAAEVATAEVEADDKSEAALANDVADNAELVEEAAESSIESETVAGTPITPSEEVPSDEDISMKQLLEEWESASEEQKFPLTHVLTRPVTIYRAPAGSFAGRSFGGVLIITGEDVNGFTPVKLNRSGIGIQTGYVRTVDLQ